MVAIKAVSDQDEIMVITRNGVVNRQRVDEMRVMGRATQGVRMINLDEGDAVVDLALVVGDDADADNADDETEDTSGNGAATPADDAPRHNAAPAADDLR